MVDWRPEGPPKRGKKLFDKTVAELKIRPGVWAVVAKVDSEGMRTHWVKMLKARGAEAETHKVESGVIEVWGLWPEAVKP